MKAIIWQALFASDILTGINNYKKGIITMSKLESIKEKLRPMRQSRIGNALFLCMKFIYIFITQEPVAAVKATITHNKKMRTMRLEAKIQIEEPPAPLTVDAMPYNSYYENNIDFSAHDTAVKALAFYLPQYHRIRENDKCWGAGFTEWTNVKKAQPRYNGNYLPRVPHGDIGYYNLLNPEVLKAQVRLAKQHKIYGFCFYYYWFSGKRLLEKPVDLFLENKDIDFPFCLCWANENWTKRWDRMEQDVIVAQQYLPDDPEKFIDDISVYFKDERYIRVNGKFLILVYSPGGTKNIAEIFTRWRQHARETGIGELEIWTCQTSNNTAESLNIEDYIDAEVQFPPHNLFLDNKAASVPGLQGSPLGIYSYHNAVMAALAGNENGCSEGKKLHKTCMAGWDNAARRESDWVSFYGYSTRDFYSWARYIAEYTKTSFTGDERIMFVNAWNEWGEGTYLEPDVKYGYSNINTFSRAIAGLPYIQDIEVITGREQVDLSCISRLKIAVQAHIYYTDTLDEIVQALKNIPVPYDCYISTDAPAKTAGIQKAVSSCGANNIYIEVFENRGRDVAPFLLQLGGVYKNYDLICHIHSKKSVYTSFGDGWRKHLLKNLLGSKHYTASILKKFLEDPELGIVFPETYPLVKSYAEWGKNAPACLSFVNRLGIYEYFDTEPVFPAGNMFWARTDAIRYIFEENLTMEDFPEEQGQQDLTTAHMLERIWVPVAAGSGYKYKKTVNCESSTENYRDCRRLAIFAHYDRQNVISDSDFEYLAALKKVAQRLIFVSNSALNANETEKLASVADAVILRENHGYDFGMWKEGILSLPPEELRSFDELIIANSSCFAPVYDLRNAFSEMECRDCDFWGITMFPEYADGSFINEDKIDEHIQSYFVVFRSPLLSDECFLEYWRNLIPRDTRIKTIASHETKMTKYFRERGFKADVLITEYEGLSCNDVTIFETKPYQMLLLGSPFIKKRSLESAHWSELQSCSPFSNCFKRELQRSSL